MESASSNINNEQVDSGPAETVQNDQFSSQTPFGRSETRPDRRRLFKRRIVDRSVRATITLGGWIIISIIVVLMTVLLTEVIPLFNRAKVLGSSSFESRMLLLESAAEKQPQYLFLLSRDLIPIATAVNSDGKILTVIYRNGAVAVFQAEKDPQVLQIFSTAPAGDGPQSARQLRLAVPAGNQRFSAISEQGELLTFSFSISEIQKGGRPVSYVTSKIDPPAVLGVIGENVHQLIVTDSERGEISAIISGERDVLLAAKQKKKGLVSNGEIETKISRFSAGTPGKITAAVFSHSGKNIALGTDRGELLIYEVSTIQTASGSPPPLIRIQATSAPAGITVLSTVGAGRNIIVGDSSGEVSEWGLVSTAAGRQLEKMVAFPALPGAVGAIAVSTRNRVFSALANDGDISIQQATTGKSLLHIDDTAFATGNDNTAVSNLAISPRSDRLYYTDYSGKVFIWNLNVPFPDVSLGTLFSKVWYEDYSEPEYVWQSGGGSDLVESKFSLIPLIFGTLKGTFYALIFSIPLAFISALYTSQFLDPKLRNWIKPTVELMSAVPSVVVGLIAGLWLAPRIESVLTGILILPIVFPLLIIASRIILRLTPGRLAQTISSERGILVLIPLAAAAIWAALLLGPAVESLLFNGDLRNWIATRLGMTYDQRNCIVVGIAMGFAVIPLMFTVAEDVLSSVPRSLVAGSLALGATRWETAFRIVLPTASPGLFAAVMLGLGRAIGETMIVLMATGNTPLIDLSPFNGFRALSANIAVELPEAPVGSSLYRILFLTALLLFLVTFVINTLSEIIRTRLRRRYDAG